MKNRISWVFILILLSLVSMHPFLTSCLFNPVEPKAEATPTPVPLLTATPVPASPPAATPTSTPVTIPTPFPTAIPTPIIVAYQNFEVSNGTPGLYFENWNNSTPIFSPNAYGSAQAMEVMFTGAAAPGGAVAVNPMTAPYDFSGATVALAWVNDPGVAKSISLRIQDVDENADTALSDQMTLPGQWTQLTWQLSSYRTVDLTRTMNVILSSTESNTVFFDEIGKQ